MGEAWRVRAIFIGSVGNLVEWYDIYAYTAFQLYFAGAFFPTKDPLAQQLASSSLFAATFIVRPIGGWLFGYLADRHGRRLSLIVSVLMMCVGSLMIAATPDYETAGLAAPLLLALARVIQGISLGGEYGASAVYLAEMAGEQRRGFYSSFQYVTLIGGQLFAILILLALQNVFLTQDQLKAWGWRIPFAIGAALSVVAALMRRRLPETDEFSQARKHNRTTQSLLQLFRYPREILLVIGLTAGGTAAFYTFTTYMQIYLRLTVHFSVETTTLITFCSLLFAVALQPIYGAISDRVGRKPVLLFFGIGGVLLTVPILTLLKETSSPVIACLLICGAWLFTAGYTSINAVVKAELFPTSVRTTGVALPYAFTVAIFGGTAPAVALWFKQRGAEDAFYWYLTGMIFLSALVYGFMRETAEHSMMRPARSEGA